MQHLSDTFKAQLSLVSTPNLIAKFNQQVCSSAWVGAKAYFIHALLTVLEERGIDCSAVKTKKGVSLKKNISLEGNFLLYN